MKRIEINRRFPFTARRGLSNLARAIATVAMCVTTAWAQSPPAGGGGGELVRSIQVRPGDTFSGITARFTGDPSQWRRFYDPQRSRLPNPNLIEVGSVLELVREPGRAPYLRMAEGGPAKPSAAPGTAAAQGTAAPQTAAAPSTQVKPPAGTVGATPAVPRTGTKGPGDSLVVGVLPNIAADTLLSQYENMKRYLERLNRGKVQIATAPNFRAFFGSLMQGDYDLAISAPHFARIAQLDRGLIPVAIYEPPIQALFVSPAEKPVASPLDLRGKSLAFANPQSLVAMYGMRWLGQHNLQAHQDYKISAVRSDLGVGRLMLIGEAAAAIMSNGEFRQIPAEERARLKVVTEFASIPNFIVLAHPRLGTDFAGQLGNQLRNFLADKTDGAAFAKATGVGGITAPAEATLRELDPHVDETRRLMGVAK